MLKQAIIVNKDLGLGKGKMVGQACHGMCYYMEEIALRRIELKCLGEVDDPRLLERYEAWTADKVMMKIALKATEKEIRALTYLLGSNRWYHQVHDLGLTQVPKNSLTCLVVEPLPEEEFKDTFGHLKLL